MLRFDDSPTADAWVQVHVPGRDAQSAQVEFQFNPAFVLSVLQRSPLPDTRGGSLSPDLEQMLMEDTIKLGDDAIYVAAWLDESPDNSKGYRLRVDIDAPGKIQRDMFVTLHWNGAIYEVELPKNTGRLIKKSPHRFSRWFAELPSGEIRLSFEFKHGSKN